MSGSITSSTTTSGRCERADSKAAAPSPAVAMFQPSYRSAIDTISARTASSSTTSTLIGFPSARRITTRSTGAWGWLTAFKYAQHDESRLWHSYVSAVSRPSFRSEPISPTGDRAADTAQDEEHHTDDQQNPPEGNQQWQWQHITEDEQDDSEDDHDNSISDVLIVLGIILLVLG